jgi:hypothetical protein
LSIFDFPRLHFHGTQLVNPGTGNNNSLGPGTELTVTSDTDHVQPVKSEMTDEQFAAWLSGADASGLVRGQWNLFGDMSARFLDVRIRSAQLDFDTLVTDGDPLIGSPVSLNNIVVCDVNPDGFDATQIFSEALEIKCRQALGGSGVFVSRHPSRAMTHALNWFRNVSFHGTLPQSKTSGGAGGASASFQCSIEIAKGDLEPLPDVGAEFDEVLHHFWPKCDESGQPASRVLATLHAALKREAVRGLVVRFNLYLCYPRIADSDLARQFAVGLAPENPAIGLVTGTIAPWRDGEPPSVTMGRFLKSAVSYANPYREDHKPYYLAPAVAKVADDRRFVSIDLINTMPEDGQCGEKWNMGTVCLGVRSATAPSTDPAMNQAPAALFGRIDNTRQAYLDHGGLYDVDLTDVDAKTIAMLDDPGCELVLLTGYQGALLYEPEYMVASGCEGAYMEQAAPGAADPVVRPPQPETLPPALRGYVPIHVRRAVALHAVGGPQPPTRV